MASNFSRVLTLLRKERKISQKEAAQALGVSQALLSHYENGQREPGLSFVVKAADYYNASCDYLLGRSLSKEGSALTAEQMLDMETGKDNVLKGSVAAMLHKKLMVGSVGIIMDIAGKTGSKDLVLALSSYFSHAYYKAFRYLYSANKDNNQKAFSISDELFDYACDSEMKLLELKIKSAALGIDALGQNTEELTKVDMSSETLGKEYPGTSYSLFSSLQGVSENIEKKLKK